MANVRPPSRILLIAAGALTQLGGAACLVLALASLPAVHDQHHGMQQVLATAAAAAAACVCGYLVYHGRIIPLVLAMVIDAAFGVVLPRPDSAAGALLHILPAESQHMAESAITGGAIAMFATAVLCALAIPSALKMRRYERTIVDDDAERAIVEDDSQRPADTLRGFGGPSARVRTQMVRSVSPRSRPVVVIGVAATLTAVGVVVILSFGGSERGGDGSGSGSGASGSGTAASGSGSGASGSGSGSKPTKIVASVPVDGGAAAADGGSAAPVDAGAAPDADATPSLDDFVARTQLAALARLDAKELAAILSPKAFAFGVEANEIAEGRDAIGKLLRHDLGEPPSAGFKLDARNIAIGREKSLAWIAAVVDVGGRKFTISEVVALQNGAWQILALEWAVAVPDETAYRLARSGELPVPDAIPDHHDASTLAAAMRKAFASKAAFAAARSPRADAINIGSAGERIGGGKKIQNVFAQIKATIALRGAVAVGSVDDGGWGAANVEFTSADRDGTQVTQTFRVLAAWVRDGPEWRVVQTQWSNAK